MVRTGTTTPQKRRPAGCTTESSNVRVAALSDIHGNLPALEAVLSEVERESPDLIVSCGDVASGPMPAETISLLMSLPRARFVRGNADRGLVDAFDRRPKGRMPGPFADSAATRIRGAGSPEAEQFATENVLQVPTVEEAMEFLRKAEARQLA